MNRPTGVVVYPSYGIGGEYGCELYLGTGCVVFAEGEWGGVVRGIMKNLANMHAVSEAVLWGYGSEYSAGGLVLRAFLWLLY